MRKFNITVNGVSYEVEVEEVAGNTSSNTAPASVAKPEVPAPAKQVESAPAVKSVPSAVPEGATTIEAPMPGNIWKVGVEEGQEVKAGDVLIILEAMKMENEILAPVDGVVASVHVVQGASVNGGDVLVSLE
ncbi:MAG TPA: biotin/lipoyl-containing protein [Clostridia bacterium]|nr:biotin/lipoyl-containing protein [Clostridia bacterium]